MNGPGVLVTGATGTVGRAVVLELLAAGQRVRAGVRDLTEQVPADVERVRLDFADPLTAGPALVGVDRLFLLRPPSLSDVRTGMGPLVQAAARQGLRRVVVLSVMGVNPALPHWRMERMVRDAGLACTALRPAYFSQNLLTALRADLQDRSQIRLAAGHGRVSFVDTRDVAAVAARVLTAPEAHAAEPLTLTGPAALSFDDAASLLTAELGRPVTYVRQGLLERRRELLGQHAPSGYAWVQLAIDVTTRLGLAAKVTDGVARVLGRPATPLAQFVHDHRDAWLQPSDR